MDQPIQEQRVDDYQHDDEPSSHFNDKQIDPKLANATSYFQLEQTMDATIPSQPRKSATSSNQQPAKAKLGIISKESYAKIPERDDFDTFDDDEETQVSPQVRKHDFDRNNVYNSMEDGFVGAQTFKIEIQQMQDQNRSYNFDVREQKRRTTIDDDRRSMATEPSQILNRPSGQYDQQRIDIDDQSYQSPFRDYAGAKHSRSHAKEVSRQRLNTNSSSPDHNLMANQTRDTSLFQTVQHSKDVSKQQTPHAELKSEPAMSKRSTARKDTFRQLQHENEKLKTCIDFLVQGGDWNELVQMFGENDPTLKDVLDNYINKSNQQEQHMNSHQQSLEVDRYPVQYTEQQIHDQNRSVERVKAYNSLDKQRVHFMDEEPEQISPIAYASPSRQLSQPSFFSSTEQRPKNRLTTREKRQLNSEHHRLREFERIEASRNTPVVQFSLQENKQTHNNLLQDPKFRKKFNYNSNTEDDEQTDSDETESIEDDQSNDEEESYTEKMVRQKRIDSNPFLKMIVSNVDKAFKYNPQKQDRPNFKFYGAGALGQTSKKHSQSLQNSRFSTGASQDTADNSFKLSWEYEEPPLILNHHDGRPISVPGKYLIDFKNQEEDEIEQLAHRTMAAKMNRRKRGVPKYYLYNYNQVNERPVDKFRMATKSSHEKNATVKFVHQHNQLFYDQKEMENQGVKIPADKKVQSVMTDDQVHEIVRDYSSYDFDRAEKIKEFVAELRTAAREATRWAIIGSNNPGAPKSRLKYPLVELYGEYAIDLGIQNAEDTELNMSPEGKLRRKALHDKEIAQKKIEDFRNAKNQPKDQGLNLTLKRVPP